MLKTDSYYRSLADAALLQAGIDEPPVPIEALAARLAIPVRLVKLPAFFQGAAINEDGLPVLLLNADRGEMARRRVMAHILGHVLMVLDDPEQSYPRATGDHHPADVIADELVMPTRLVNEQAQKWFNDYGYLARLFGVGENEMLEKMRSMGLIKAHGIMWDY